MWPLTLFTAQCSSPALMAEWWVYFLVGFSVPSSLYLYLWLHVVELALVLVPSLLMVPTYCFLSWDGFRVEKYARECCLVCCEGG